MLPHFYISLCSYNTEKQNQFLLGNIKESKFSIT